MKVKIGAAVFFLWLITGIMGFFLLFDKKSASPMKNVAVKLSALNKTNTDATRWLSHLKGLLESETALAAIFVTNEKGALASSLYEASRLSPQKYQQLVENFSNMNEVILPSHLKLLKIRDIGHGNSVFLVSRSKTGYVDLYRRLRKKQPFMRWVIASYFAAGGLLVLFIIFAFFFDKGADAITPAIKPSIKSETRPKSEKSIKNSEAPMHDEPVSTTDKSLLLQNQLIQVLNEFSQTLPFTVITFFSFESNRWMPVTQKKGQLFIRGEALKNIPGALQGISNPAQWVKPLVDPSRESILVPVRRRNSLFGAFYFQLAENHQLPDEAESELLEKAAEFSRSIFIQKTYERAIIDDETGAFTYPYFFFAVKERILAKNRFAVLIFDLLRVDTTTSKSLRKWVLQVRTLLEDLQLNEGQRGLLSSNQQIHILTRIENNRFAILFDLNRDGFDLNSAEEISQEIRRLTDKVFSSKVAIYGSLVPREEETNSADEYIRRLQYALKLALQGKSFGITLSNSPLGVL